MIDDVDGTAQRYARLQLFLSVVSVTVTVVYLTAVIVAGGGVALARRIGGPAWLQVAIVAAALGTGRTVLTFPIGWVRAFWLPRRFGVLHQPLGAWLLDHGKAAMIGGGLALAAIEIVYGLLRWTPAWWWLVAAAVFFAGYALAALVVPVWILPLFYRMSPLADATLRERLLMLASRIGVPVMGVWVADQSRKSRTANAAVVGLAGTRRIVLFDTLLAQFTPDEIESVLAHELGHHVHGDVLRGLFAEAVLTLVTFAIAAWLLPAGARLLGLAGAADPGGLPWLALVVLLLGLVMLPAGNAFSRRLEREADDFAIDTTGNATAFVGAMERLARLNLAERRPSRWKELLLHSHPSIDRRIARAQTRARVA